MTCSHPEESRQYVERADAVAELARRGGHNQELIDVLQNTTYDEVDVEVCAACGQLFVLVVEDDG